AFGHTADDQVETVLMHLFRGAGLKGVSGMTALNGNLFRPLLDVTHAETVQYCRILGLQFAEDPTNDDISNPRNLLRREIIPAAEVGYPGLSRAILRFATSGRRDIEHLEMEAKEALAFVSRGGELVPELVRALAKSPQYHMLRLQAIDRGDHVSADILDDVVARLEPDLSQANKEWEYPTLEREQVESVSLRVPGRTEVAGVRFDVVHGPPGASLHNRMAVSPGHQAYLELHGSEGLLSVRSRRPGDRMRPLGSPGNRKVQDIFVDRQVPARLRSLVPVIEMNGEIIWLVGLAIADSVRIADDTGGSLHLAASRL
ncbi:MAG TPA: tRNA lysidine(34) synthetase TilS, partial [Chloroflexota bacterium]|nr:tRNA lysidine(34) synthetase TilS [Chloroflexota bacterium]